MQRQCNTASCGQARHGLVAGGTLNFFADNDPTWVSYFRGVGQPVDAVLLNGTLKVVE